MIGVCAANLLGSGTWGQNVKISRELLQYAAQHSSDRFLTDYRTLNEMYMLNGMASPPNVASTNYGNHFRLIDREARRAAERNASRFDGVLLNSLNLERASNFHELLAAHCGELLYETPPIYRAICMLAPPLRRLAWAVRKPPAQVYRLVPEGGLLPVGVDTLASFKPNAASVGIP